MSRRRNTQQAKPATKAPPSKAMSPAPPKQPHLRHDAARAAALARRRTRRIRNVAIAVVGLVLVASPIYISARRNAALPGDSVAQMPSRHIAATDPTPIYSTDPPTSGPHVPEPPTWGVYKEPMAKPVMVHGLEDGGVVISYQPDLDAATVDKLTRLANGSTAKVILAPYPGLTNPIVLTAWTRIDRLDTFDEARIQRFVEAWSGKDHHGDSGS